MTDEQKTNGDGSVAEAIGIGLFKDLTLALIENARVNRALIMQLAGTPGEEGFAGLLESVADLNESVMELDSRVTGLAIKFSGVEFVLDKLAEIKDREPTWRDAVAAKAEFDKKIEDEIKEAEAAEREQEAPEPVEPEKDKKPAMVSNTKKKKEHPLPVAPPQPG